MSKIRAVTSVLILGTSTSVAAKAHLPATITYVAGVAAGIVYGMTVSAGFIGQSLLDAAKIATTSSKILPGAYFRISSPQTATVNQERIATGVKINTVAKFLVPGK